jgi:hypothetical protein
VEVYYQPKWNFQQLHIAQQLRLMDRQDFLNALKLQQQTSLDQYVKSQRLVKYQPFILDFDQALIHGSDLAKLQFAHQTSFIDTLNQARPFEAMHLYGGANYHPAHLISLLEKWMHPIPLHQANEENEEFCAVPFTNRVTLGFLDEF